MKKNFSMSFLIFIIVGYVPILVTNGFADTKTFYERSKQTVVRYNQDNNLIYDYSVLYNIGKNSGSVTPTSSDDTYRTQHYFELVGIPADAQINSVKLYFFTGAYVYSNKKFKVTKISGTNTYGNLWNEIDNSNVQASDLQYDNPQNWVTTSTFTNTVINSLNTTNILYLGSISQNESDPTVSSASLELRIVVDYTITSVSFTADNNFTAPNSTHGKIIVNGVQRDAPYLISNVNVGTSQTLQAVSPQTDNQGYQLIWHTGSVNKSEWQRNSSFKSNNQTYTFTVSTSDNNTRYEANLRKVTNITFQNNFIGVGNGGVIKVNDTQISSPTASYSVVELNPITATAVSQGINNITYYFTNWSTGSTNITETFYPTTNSTITANYVGIAAQSVNLNFEASNPNLPITLNWTEYPNDSVTQYQIWRRVKYKRQPTEDPVLLATVQRGTTSFTDYDFYGTNLGFTDWMLWYDVRSYYSTEGTYPDPYWWQVFSGGLIPEKPDDLEENLSVVKENTLDNFPNPFNPSTIIKYQIVKAGRVTLKVYDTLGREVANLVDKEQPSGKYSVNFNASNLSSGIYLYRITANGFMAVKKMILMK